MFNKKVLILFVILIGLIIAIICIPKNNGFKPPSFDSTAKKFDKVPDENKVVKIGSDYSFYINGKPYIKDDYIYVDFYSLTSENIYLKVRVLQNDEIVAESGLLKSNESVEKIKLKKDLNGKNISYLIMSYEKDTYYSLGEITLNLKLEEK